jgi:hypothetical protein
MKTLAANSQVRVYRGVAPSGHGGTAPVLSCLKSSGKSRRLGPLQRLGKSASVRGPFALKATWTGAVEERKAGTNSAKVFVISQDARTGKTRRCLVGSGDRPGRFPAVRHLFIDKTGALAWGAFTASPTGQAPEIGVCDSQGNRILDSGAGVEIDSLELRGSVLSWVNAGGPRSAVLH